MKDKSLYSFSFDVKNKWRGSKIDIRRGRPGPGLHCWRTDFESFEADIDLLPGKYRVEIYPDE